MQKMNLSNKRVDVKNTYEMNNIINEKLRIKNANGNVQRPLSNSFILYEIKNLKILIDPNDIFYLSRLTNIHSVSFSKDYLVGYNYFNMVFYSVLDLESLLIGEQPKQNQKKGIFIYFYDTNNVIQLDNIKICKKNRLIKVFPQEVSNCNYHVLSFSSHMYKDINNQIYYVIDKNKFKNII